MTTLSERLIGAILPQPIGHSFSIMLCAPLPSILTSSLWSRPPCLCAHLNVGVCVSQHLGSSLPNPLPVSAKHLQKKHFSMPFPHSRVLGFKFTCFGNQPFLSSSPPTHQPVFLMVPEDHPVASEKPGNPQSLLHLYRFLRILLNFLGSISLNLSARNFLILTS